MSDTTAKIRAKGCETTGLDEDLASKMFAEGAGKHHMAIIELQVVKPHGPDTEGKRSVDLVITQLEPAERGSDLEAHLRGLTRTVYYNRGLKSETADGQLALESQSDIEPSVSEVVAAGKALEPHGFAPTGDDDQICDTCGEDKDEARHQIGDQPDPDQEE